MARRRPSRVMCGLGNRVNRTPSGLPLCSTCHKELGFCTHSSLFGKSARNTQGGPAAVPASSAAAPAPAAGEQGTAAPDEESVPSALAMNGRRKSREIEALQDFLQPGTKRRRSAAAQDGALRKSKRRGIVDQRKESDLAAIPRGKRTSKRSSTRAAKRHPRRSTRFADEAETPSEKRASLARNPSGGGSCPGDDIPNHERKLLRFRGFEANDAGKECMSCYGVARITVSFMCEERRERAAAESQVAKDREQQSSENNQGGRGGSTAPMNGLGLDVPHVMCVDCFRLFVASRVSDRKLVTSHDFDGYTVGCPMGCADSFIDPSCFEEVMGAEFMVKYRRFSAIHLASHMRIVWCPACHCGVVPSAAAAAATRRPSVVPAPEVPALTRGGGAGSYLRGLWGEGAPAPAGEGRAGEAAAPGRRPSLCIGCPGCQASLCLSCRALHAPGVDCTAAAAAADAANAADANGGVWAGVGDEVGGELGSAGSGGGGTSMTAALGESQEEGAPLEAEQCTKRCPSCRVPIFKDGGCNHMKCSMCQHEFCWLHLTEWIEGGECQRGHWSSNPALNRAYNAQRLARGRQGCAIS